MVYGYINNVPFSGRNTRDTKRCLQCAMLWGAGVSRALSCVAGLLFRALLACIRALLASIPDSVGKVHVEPAALRYAY